MVKAANRAKYLLIERCLVSAGLPKPQKQGTGKRIYLRDDGNESIMTFHLRAHEKHSGEDKCSHQ